MPNLSDKLRHAKIVDPTSDVEGEINDLDVYGQYSIPGDRRKRFVGLRARNIRPEMLDTFAQDEMAISLHGKPKENNYVESIFSGTDAQKADDVIQRIIMGATNDPNERDKIRRYLNKRKGVHTE